MAFQPMSGLIAARAGLGFCRQVNDKSGINAAATVLTDAGLLYATETGKRDIIMCFYAHINTVSDWLEFEIGYTVGADGTGTFTPITPKFRLETGATPTSQTPAVTHFYDIPLIVKDTDGGAWTARAQTNDAGAAITLGFNGWREKYP